MGKKYFKNTPKCRTKTKTRYKMPLGSQASSPCNFFIAKLTNHKEENSQEHLTKSPFPSISYIYFLSPPFILPIIIDIILFNLHLDAFVWLVRER